MHHFSCLSPFLGTGYFIWEISSIQPNLFTEKVEYLSCMEDLGAVHHTNLFVQYSVDETLGCRKAGT